MKSHQLRTSWSSICLRLTLNQLLCSFALLLLVVVSPTPTSADSGSSSSLILYGRGSSLAAAMYENALFAYEASGEWTSYLSTPWAMNLSTATAANFVASYVASGSGDGKKQLVAGAVDFAGSDSVFTSAEYVATPDLINVPAMAAAVVMVYNLPELANLNPVPHLILDRQTLPAIFSGNITMWNDPAILALQDPSVAAVMPNAPIQVVVRSDSSGTSNIFTRALSSFSSAWAKTVGFADLPTWPAVLKPVKMPLSSGVAAYVAATPYSLSYSPQSDADGLMLPSASVINAAGAVVRATTSSITAVILEKGGSFDSRYSVQLVDPSSASGYPIASYTYFCLRSRFMRSSCEARALLVNYLRWFYTSQTTAAIAARFGFVVLPAVVAQQMIDVVTNQVMCKSNSTDTPYSPAVYIPPTRTHLFSTSLLAQSLASLLTASYQAIDSSYHTSLQVQNNAESVADVLSGNAAGAFVAEAAYDGVELFQAPNEVRASSSSTASSSIRLLLDDHPEIAVLPVGVTSLVPIHNVKFNTTLSALPNPVPSLIFDLPTLAKIMLGEIQMWDDDAIHALNPSLSAFLPHSRITVVLFDGVSEINALWRGVLSDAYANFGTKVGQGNNIPSALRVGRILTTTVETRLEYLVTAVSNSFSIIQYYQKILATTAQLEIPPLSTSSSSVAAPTVSVVLNVSTATMSACLRQGSASDLSLLMNPSSVAFNPASNVFAAESYTSYQPNTWASQFEVDVSANSANQRTCWPFTVAIYAILPMKYTNATDSQVETLCMTQACQATRATLESSTLRQSLSYPTSAETEPLRLSSLFGNGAHGMATLRFLYWIFSGGLLTRPQFSLGMLPVVETTRSNVRQALEHGTIDGQFALVDFPVKFRFASYIMPLSYLLSAVGLIVVLVLAAGVFVYRSNPVLRASSVPFCFYLLFGSALQYIALPLLGVAEPNGGTCMSEIWLISVGFVTAYGSLWLKTLRILFIMKMKKLKVSGLTNTVMSFWLMAVVCVMLVVLAAWQGHAPLVGTYTTQTNMTPHVLHHQCGSSITGNAGSVYLYLVVSLMFVLLVAATVVSIRIRHVPAEFNESKSLGLSIYVCLLMLALIFLSALLLWSGQQRDAYTLLFIVGIFLNTTATLGFMLATKLWIIHEGQDVALAAEAYTRDPTSSIIGAGKTGMNPQPSQLPITGGVYARPSTVSMALRSGNWTVNTNDPPTIPLSTMNGKADPSSNNSSTPNNRGTLRVSNRRGAMAPFDSPPSAPRLRPANAYKSSTESPGNTQLGEIRRVTSGEVVVHMRTGDRLTLPANSPNATGRRDTRSEGAKVKSIAARSSNSSSSMPTQEEAGSPTQSPKSPAASGGEAALQTALPASAFASLMLASLPDGAKSATSAGGAGTGSGMTSSESQATVAGSRLSVNVQEHTPESAVEDVVSPLGPSDLAFNGVAEDSEVTATSTAIEGL